MQLFFAPLEGITGYIYRNAYEEFFGGIDIYYSPFVVTRDRGIMKKKELRDILPENNERIKLVPQLLTNKAHNFLCAARQMKDLGYQEVNLNLGCPSGTVVSKGRGAGFLGRPEELQRFLEEAFNKCPCDISIKTRIGVEDKEEFYDLLEIYNQYPICRLIVHPRTRKEFYKGKPHMDIFDYAYTHSKNVLCYNGDVSLAQEYDAIEKKYQNLDGIMVGRGLIARPGFVMSDDDTAIKESIRYKKNLQNFLGRLLDDYCSVMSGDIHALHKMKEIWLYIAPNFTNYEKYLKKIKKTNKLSEYKLTVSNLFNKEELL